MSAPLWKAAEAARACGVPAPGGWVCTGISSDSRKVGAGDLFVALAGPNFDGHDFVVDALGKGAVAALVSRRPEGVGEDAPLIVVDDVLAGLRRLAEAARERAGARIISVTGSVGKTGTKETLGLVLSAQAPTFANPASFNNHWGVPLSLAALPREVRFGIFEIGMNHAGEIGPLARLVRADVAIVTTVEPVHLEFFSSVDEIADAKAEIFDGMDAGGVAVLNAYCDRLAAAARARGIGRIVTFGAAEDATVRLVSADLGAESSTVTAAVAGREIGFTVGTPGRHWVTIALGVLGAVYAAGADMARAAASLADAKPLPGRGARRRIGLDGASFTLIDESYNANPTSVRAAIANLAITQPEAGGRRIAVLGDMRELGDEAPRLHAGLADALTEAKIDLVFTVGPNMAHLRDALPVAMRGGHAERSDDMAGPVAGSVGGGDVVMIKGSLGTRMAPIVAALVARGTGEAA